MFRVRLMSAETVRRVSGILALAFDPKVALILAVAVAGAAGRASAYTFPASVFRAHYLGAIALVLLSLLVHEFGHAAACAFFGARPDEIGAGVYLMYPAFYSDVNDAWRLSRKRRVIVDLAGMYFQVVLAAGFVLVYELTGWEAFRAALVLVYGSLVFSLNPFFKFDGYWVLSDALGVTNLGLQWRRLLTFAVDRVRGRATKALPWPPGIAVCVVLCSALSLSLWAKFLLHVGPMLVASSRAYVASATPFAQDLVTHPARISVTRVLGFLAKTYLFACAIRIAWMLARTAVGWVRRIARGREWQATFHAKASAMDPQVADQG